jgi:hypothetical protein
MTVGPTICRGAVAAALLALGSVSAQASLIPVAPENFQGTGLGAVNTILTITSPGSTGFESGSVSFNDMVSGDVVKTGNSQTQTRTLGELGVTSASSLRVVFNASEPGSAPGITLSDLVLNIWNSEGKLLFTSGAFAATTFADTQMGAGNSGFVFALDAKQQELAAAAFTGAFQGNIVGLSASAGCSGQPGPNCLAATGGLETFFVAGSPGVTPPIPEPGTAALMAAGLGVMGYLGKRRSRSRN